MIVSREQALREIDATRQWDVLVIGGGATGLGTALEAATRGYRTLLIERLDFAKGTSSRSTKLLHGGVRYLEQLNFPLVMDALRERGRIFNNAPHLARRLPFVVPAYDYVGLPYYGLGLKVYEWMSGHLSLGRSSILSRDETIRALPTVKKDGLKGGILYYDGQFDDARFAVSLLRSIQDAGGTAINYMEAVRILQRNGKVTGVRVRDAENGNELELLAKVVINATGVFAEDVQRMDDPAVPSLIMVSQGTHFVLPESWLPGDTALMIPKTDDGRVLFAIPWHHRLLVGTTDEPAQSSEEPRPLAQEYDFLAAHIKRFLGRQVSGSDVLSVWSGLRPLLRSGHSGNTSKLSRDHKILISASGLVTVTGGKWTTYRLMGEDTINRAAPVGNLPASPSQTSNYRLHGWSTQNATADDVARVYGSDLPALHALCTEVPDLIRPLHPRLPYNGCHVVWAARHEMARSVEDVLARRTRALFLDARAAIEAAPEVARLLAAELGHDTAWASRSTESFRKVASGYIYS